MRFIKTLTSIEFDSRMKKAIQKLADEQPTRTAAVVRQAVGQHLQNLDRDWPRGRAFRELPLWP